MYIVICHLHHDPFNLADYMRLNDILSEKDSPLQEYSFQEINDFVEKARKKGKNTSLADAITGANPTELTQHVVQGAALSTHAFWHIIILPKIRTTG